MFGSITSRFGLNQVSKKSYLIFASFFLVMVIVFMTFKSHYKITINLSESLPQSFFLVEKNTTFGRNHLVYFKFQSDDQRFFKNGVEMVKIVRGVPGDKVDVVGQKIYINGEYLATAKKVSKSGENLHTNKSKTLGADEYFVFAPNRDSYDSRYASMGYVKSHQVMGRVVYAK